MIFMVLVGGLGTFEGPILGAVVLFVIQDQFGNSGAWYLVGLGATAIAVRAASCRAASGERSPTGFAIQLLPVGYTLRAAVASAPAAAGPTASSAATTTDARNQ